MKETMRKTKVKKIMMIMLMRRTRVKRKKSRRKEMTKRLNMITERIRKNKTKMRRTKEMVCKKDTIMFFFTSVNAKNVQRCRDYIIKLYDLN